MLGKREEKKLQKRLDEVQAKCRERIIDIDDVKKMISVVEKKLINYGIKKKNFKDVTFTYGLHFDKPNSYKYAAYCTEVELKHDGKKWLFVGAARVNTGSTNKHLFIKLTDLQLKDISALFETGRA